MDRGFVFEKRKGLFNKTTPNRYFLIWTVDPRSDGPKLLLAATAGKNHWRRANTAVPWPEFAIPSSWARFRERKTRGGRAEHDELTSRENGAEDGPKEARGSRWQRLGLTLGVTGLPSTTTTTRGRDGCGRARHPIYIARRRSKTRKGEIRMEICAAVFWKGGSGVGVGRKVILTRGPGVSVTGRVRWNRYSEAEATWEREEDLRKTNPQWDLLLICEIFLLI
jgi:hypothetical protein